MAPVSPRWEHAQTVAGFVAGQPNPVLMDWATRLRAPFASGPGLPRCLDIGCGAGRNAFPLAELGYDVAGTDLSWPMVRAAHERPRPESPRAPQFIFAPMAPLPFPDATFDLLIAHGIWNLARSDEEFRAAVAEAARVARPGAGLFVFTFSRHSLPPEATPDPGQSFTFSSWNGEPQVFLTEDQLITELARAGFERDEQAPLTEYNLPRPGELRAGGPPVIWEGRFRCSRSSRSNGSNGSIRSNGSNGSSGPTGS